MKMTFFALMCIVLGALASQKKVVTAKRTRSGSIGKCRINGKLITKEMFDKANKLGAMGALAEGANTGYDFDLRTDGLCNWGACCGHKNIATCGKTAAGTFAECYECWHD